jgi:outer membrane protein OmpA-like peptidoglycan-associated protein
MEHRVERRARLPVVVARVGLALLAAAAVFASAVPARAQSGDDQAETGEPRVRSLIYRRESLDGAERVAEGGEETTVMLAADVLFEFDQASLNPQAQTLLGDVAARLGELGPRTVTIAGHTDSHGDDAYNQALSERRAAAVRDALAAHLGDGGADFTFEVAGRGEAEPVAPNENEDGSDNPESRARNRRVEIRYPNP